jgi:outer membrane protein assembly factor BamB
MMAALNRNTGKTVWASAGTGDKPGYATPIIVDVKGLRQVITMTSGSAIGVAAETGKLLWRYDQPARYEVIATQPVYYDGHVAVFGTWGRGSTLLKLNVDGERCTAEEIWRTTELDNEHGGVVLLDGYLYGHADGNHQKRHWACIEWKTGKTMWTSNELQGPRSGCLTTADGMLYVMDEKCMVGLVPVNPEKFEIVSQFRLPKQEPGPSWAHPVVCGGRLYIRYSQYLFVYNVSM